MHSVQRCEHKQSGSIMLSTVTCESNLRLAASSRYNMFVTVKTNLYPIVERTVFPVKKITAILLAITLFILFDQGCNKKQPVVTPENEIMPGAGESAPEKPTVSEAAMHNAAIDARDVHIIQFDDPDEGDHIAVLETSQGEIRIRLFAEQASKTVEAFERLVREGHYNGQSFHTVVNGYKIEGGGTGDANEFPEEEFSLDLWNFRGAVAVGNNGLDFLIVQAEESLNPISDLYDLNFPGAIIDKYADVGGAPHQDWKNTVFGQVISGMDTVDKIAGAKLSEEGKPAEPVIITKAEIEIFSAESQA